MIKKLCVSLLITALPSIAVAEKDLDDLRSRGESLNCLVKYANDQTMRNADFLTIVDTDIGTPPRKNSVRAREPTV